MRTVIYTRISRDGEGNGLGVQRQEDDCRKLADRLGFVVGEVFVDNDLSAYSGKPRTEYLRMMEQVDAGRIDAVLAWHPDRLHRSPLELEYFIAAVEKHGTQVHTAQAGQIDLTTPGGRIHARNLGNYARYESEQKSARLRSMMAQKAAKGEVLGGRIPLGWKARKTDGEIVLDRPAAARIKKATEEVVAGASLASIQRRWNDEGFLTLTGKQWRATSVKQVLHRARNAGLYEHRGEIVTTSPWPAIVDEVVWRQCRAVLDDPRRRPVDHSNRVKHLVSNIAVCGGEGCGQPLGTYTAPDKKNGGREAYYRCEQRGGGHTYRRVAPVDEQVIETIAAWLSRDDMLATMLASEDEEGQEDLRAEQGKQRGLLTEVAESFADGAISRAQLEAATKKINARLDAIETEMEGTRRSAVLGAVARSADPAAEFRAAPIDRKRAVIRELVTVTIQPVPKGSPRRYLPELTVIEPR